GSEVGEPPPAETGNASDPGGSQNVTSRPSEPGSATATGAPSGAENRAPESPPGGNPGGGNPAGRTTPGGGAVTGTIPKATCLPESLREVENNDTPERAN